MRTLLDDYPLCATSSNKNTVRICAHFLYFSILCLECWLLCTSDGIGYYYRLQCATCVCVCLSIAHKWMSVKVCVCVCVCGGEMMCLCECAVCRHRRRRRQRYVAVKQWTSSARIHWCWCGGYVAAAYAVYNMSNVCALNDNSSWSLVICFTVYRLLVGLILLFEIALFAWSRALSGSSNHTRRLRNRHSVHK